MSLDIKEKTSELGFNLCGIAPVRTLDEHRHTLIAWLDNGFNAGMSYMKRNREIRLNPQLLLKDARSVIVTGLNYYRSYTPAEDKPVFSIYALGKDYHKVVKDRLYKLLDYIRNEIPGTNGRVFVDSAPVLERAWGAEAGLGWTGKNSLLINSKTGSFFFIGILIIDKVLEYDKPIVNDYCGTCRKCIDACPTGAILANRTIDANKCLSYLTIENEKDIPVEFAEKAGRRVFGCDKCQEVCPWNNKAKETNIKEFEPLPEILEYTTETWGNITEEEFSRIFKTSAVMRTGYEGFMRNLKSC